jgi:hypothetical protein
LTGFVELVPSAWTATGSVLPEAGCLEFPMLVVVPEMTHETLLFVAPARTDATETVMFVSGVSVAEYGAPVPVATAVLPALQVAFCVTVTFTPVELSFEYPVGAPVSATQ